MYITSYPLRELWGDVCAFFPWDGVSPQPALSEDVSAWSPGWTLTIGGLSCLGFMVGCAVLRLSYKFQSNSKVRCKTISAVRFPHEKKKNRPGKLWKEMET